MTTSTQNTYVLTLDAARADLATVGGKGASLATLQRAGLPVPPGFHVTTAAYRRFVAHYGLQDGIVAAAGSGDADAIAALFAAHEVPDELASPIREAYTALGEPAVAVRSSATAEDLPGASFAGQQDTFLDIRGADAVVDAVRRCWASLWTARAIEYRRREGIDPADVALAVVVQELVDADAAGVLFTADPVTGATDRMVVNATWGLGESLVGGQVTPDELVLDAATGAVRERRTGDKEVMTVRTPDGPAERPVPAERRRAPVLDDARAAELAALGRRIAAHYGRPMDVEWTLAHGMLAIVQARPITGLRDPWNDTRLGDFLWTNTNLGEAIPDVMTPCTWSLVQLFMSRAMPTLSLPDLRGYGNIGGRFYLNMSLSAAMSGLVGISESRFRSLTENTFGQLPAGVAIPPVPLSRMRVLRSLVPTAVRFMASVPGTLRRLPAFLEGNPRRCAELTERIKATSDPAALARLWDDEVRRLVVTGSDMLGAAGRSDPVALLTVQKRLRKLVGDADAAALTSGITVDGEMLASLGPVVGLALLERGDIDEATYTERYGHRGPHEFEVSLPRPAEQPGWVEQQLGALREAGADPLDLLRKQEAAHRAAWERLVAAHAKQVAATRKRLRRWAGAASKREQARTEVIRAFAVARAYLLRAAELAGLGDEVFMLDVDEVAAVLRGAPVPDSSERRAAYERYAALPPYPSLIRGAFDPFAWAADPGRRADVYSNINGASAAPASASGDVTGFPGAGGVVEGVVRVLRSAEEGADLRPGEILVTTVTNIGWTPLFPRAAAVVTDVGAPLSHAAIVARELGIPAVVGTGTATSVLHTGDRVRVDGGRGTVEVLTPAT
ncbi:pyruvate, phosphate dikinase [Pseudonocardia sp. DSM 110487]|uniref:PEP/pyruvate-binding domain-containing protein n=1 Tax=Pseudonocardia sp. DSM 110487 TaxID=2865833 RepID=UPI001C6A27B5|nr:PEP/pyruvate-binding domain-containing protein [Pseudonocardia sp. DSM 110487]QYN39517.1 pyruvate, phosphate dikinase [Pseudonocardia sp. DSM 110487]